MSPDLDSFLASRKTDYSYADILTGTQEFISSTYQDLLSGEIGADDKRLIKDYIRQYLITKNLRLAGGLTTDDLTDMLYRDMAEFSFITDWLENAADMKLEEINKNTKIGVLAKEYPWLIDEVKKLSDRAAKLPTPMIKMILAKATLNDVAEKVKEEPDHLIEMLKDLIVKHTNENS